MQTISVIKTFRAVLQFLCCFFSAQLFPPLHFLPIYIHPSFCWQASTAHCTLPNGRLSLCVCPACPATMYCAVWIPDSLSSTTFCKAQRGDRPPWPFTVGFVVQQKLSKFAIVTLLEGSFRPQLYESTWLWPALEIRLCFIGNTSTEI